jgi:hypothetical protein
MRVTIFAFCLGAFLAVGVTGVSFGAERDLYVSSRDGLVSITARQSTLSDVLTRLSQELDMEITAQGASDTSLISCEITNLSLVDALERLAPGFEYMVFSQDGRSIEIRMKDGEGEIPFASEAADPGEGEIVDETAASVPPDENGEEVVDGPDEFVPDDSSSDGPNRSRDKGRWGCLALGRLWRH